LSVSAALTSAAISLNLGRTSLRESLDEVGKLHSLEKEKAVSRK
jgi:hypothetical protein